MLRARCGQVRLNTPSVSYAETEREEQWCGVWARGLVRAWGRQGVGQDRHAFCYLSDTPVATYCYVSRGLNGHRVANWIPRACAQVLLPAYREAPAGES